MCIRDRSDKGAAGQREDLSGPAIEEMIREIGGEVAAYGVVPDELEALKMCIRDRGMGDIGVLSVIVAVMVAAASGYFAIKFMLKIVGENKLWTFAVYVAILGVLVLCDQWFFHLVFKVA